MLDVKKVLAKILNYAFVRKVDVTGTTDANGYLGIPTSVIDHTKAVPIWATTNTTATWNWHSYFLYDRANSRYSVRLLTWNEDALFKSQTVTFTIYYIPFIVGGGTA